MQEHRGPSEAGLVVATLAVLALVVDGPPLWLTAALAPGAAVAATLYLLGEWHPRRIAYERLALPALAAFATLGFLRLLPGIPWTALGALAGWFLVAWTIQLELPAPDDPLPHARPFAVRCATLGLAFLAFSAVGGVVSGGLAGMGHALDGPTLVATVLLDAAIGGLAGFRLIALSGMSRRIALYNVNHYVALAGHAGAFVRVVEVPRILAPALLTAAIYLFGVYLELRSERAAPVTVRDVLPGPALLAIAAVVAAVAFAAV